MIIKFMGFAILMGSLAVVYLFETSSSASGAFRIFHWPAMILTGFGPLGLVLLCSEWKAIQNSFSLLKQSPSGRRRDTDRDAAILQQLGQDFYSEGGRAFERLEGKQVSKLLQRALERLAIKIPVSDVRNLMEKDWERTEQRLQRSVNVLGLGLRLAPSVGMLGTILGMVQLLSNLSDPSHIGSHMGLALLTTFYGLFFSLVIWTPMQHRLEGLLEAEAASFDQVIHWLELLEKRKPTQYFSDSLEPAPVPRKAVISEARV